MDDADVLLIEDNRHDMEMIIEALRERGVEDHIRTFKDGAAALDYFFGPGGCLQREAVHLPKLILLDLKLPKIGGLDILKRIKSDERTRFIPTIVFTSSNEAGDRIECYLSGANSYVVKPLDADSFSQHIADIRSYWVEMNRVAYTE